MECSRPGREQGVKLHKERPLNYYTLDEGEGALMRPGHIAASVRVFWPDGGNAFVAQALREGVVLWEKERDADR